MRICILGWELPPRHTGGLGRHCFHLAKELTNLGHTVDFFLPRENAPRVKLPFKVIEVPFFLTSDYTREVSAVQFEYTEALLNKVEADYDLVHAHDWFSVTAAAALKRPWVFTIHSTEFDRTGGLFEKRSKVLQLEKQGLQRANAVITVSKHMAAELEELFGVDRKVNVIYNGIEPRVYTPNGKYVLFVGRLTEQKGAEYFLLAAQEILKKKDIEFVICGRGHLSAELKMFARLLGIEKNIRFIGFVADKELDELYKGAALVVVPSLYEPFGVVPLEALSWGKPLIVSRSAGVSELLEGRARFVEPQKVFELAEAMIELLTDRKQANKLGRAGFELTKKLSWSKIAKQTVAVYKDVVKKSS